MTRATTYTDPVVGANGLIADDNPSFTISRAVETAAGIGFGCVVSRGTDRDNQCGLGGATPLGIACRTRDTLSTGESYKQYEDCKIVRCGFVYLYQASSGNAGAALCYNTTTGIVDNGTPGGGQVAFSGELMEDSAGADVCLCWVDFTAALDVETRLAAVELLTGTTLPAVDAAFDALFDGMGVATGISPVLVKFNDLDMKTDESEKTATLPGTATSTFVPIGVIYKCVTGSSSPDGDGTINLGTSTGGTQIQSAGACTGITGVGLSRHIPLAAAASAAIAGNATLYCNVESPDGDAGTCVYDVYLYGYQVGA
jgi:hypothetical protein